MENDATEQMEIVVPFKVAIRVPPNVEIAEIIDHIRQHVEFLVKPEQSGSHSCSIVRAWLSWSTVEVNP